MEEKRMAGNYEVTTAFEIGTKEIIIGEDKTAASDERFVVANYENNGIFERYVDALVGGDYAEIVKIFAERVRNEAIANAKLYKDNFVDYEYLICSEAFEQGFHIIKSDKGNYLHLIGIHTELSPEQFFEKCVSEELEERNEFAAWTECNNCNNNSGNCRC